MSEELVSEKVKKTCEGCGHSEEYEIVNPSDETVKAFQQWYRISRKVVIEGRGQELSVHACSLPCIPAAAVKLALPELQDEPADNIDLNSLRSIN